MSSSQDGQTLQKNFVLIYANHKVHSSFIIPVSVQEYHSRIMEKKNYERDGYGELVYHALVLTLLLKLMLINLNLV